jgi:DNA-binding FadR family transcriptional regulator
MNNSNRSPSRGAPKPIPRRASQSHQLVERIRHDVATAAWPPGTLIGNERELCARYGVGLPALRQAARILKQQGIAHMRPGKSGGLFVAARGLDAVSHALATFFAFAAVPITDIGAVLEVTRELAFSEASRKLDLHAADRLRRQLQALIEDQASQWKRVHHMVELRQAIIDRAANPAYSLIYSAFQQMFVDIIPFELETDDEQSIHTHFQLRISTGLVDALIAGDFQQFLQISEDNTRFLTQRQGTWRHSQETTHGVDNGGAGLRAKPQPATEKSESRVEKLARAVLRDIRSRGWPVGLRLGTESDLMKQYRVSQSTFRQAVRLLEQYSAATMKRGPAGGLVVTSPDPERLIGAATTYLIAVGVQIADIRPLQVALQIKAVDLLCNADGARHLTELNARRIALRSLRAAELRGALLDWHNLIATLAGNRVLEIFARMLWGVSSARDIKSHVMDEEILRVASEALGAFLEALAGNDRARARRAMIHYLSAETRWLGA